MAAEVVIVEVVTLMVGQRWICIDQYGQLRQICWLSQMMVKLADFRTVNEQYILK